jgi:gamma-glutamyltranspeptidase/glutathione hydrolase
VSIPEKLTGKDYARELARGIDLRRATPSEHLARELPIAEESPHTTHFSVIDKDHLAVSMTTTLESSYGSRVVVRGGGFLLNDEMNDFNWLPGVTTRSGRIGTEPNVVAPGKRMLSSQSPTILARDGKPVLVTGSPGSRTIINTVLCVVVNVVDFGMDLQAAVDAPRLHHQWFPDRVAIEQALLGDHPESLKQLREMGHEIAPPSLQGDAHSIALDPRTGAYVGARDRRIIDRKARN